jgi:hypothetical protein
MATSKFSSTIASHRLASRRGSGIARSVSFVDRNAVDRGFVGQRAGDPGTSPINGVAHRDDIHCPVVAPARLPSGYRVQPFGRGIVIEYDQKIIITVGSALPPRLRAEHNHPARVNIADNAIQQLSRRQRLLAYGAAPSSSWARAM